MRFDDEPETRECFLCGRNGNGDHLDKHHIFGAAYRKKSEKLGLYVYLCHHRCHEYGEHSVQQDSEVMQQLHEYGQRKAMTEHGWTVREFAMEFGQNYLPVSPEQWDCTIDKIDI